MNSFRTSFFLTLSLLLVPAHNAYAITDFANSMESARAALFSSVRGPADIAKIAAFGFFIWSGVTFMLTEPHSKPVRYDLDEIWEGTDLIKNFQYLILDGLIGHKSKRPSVRMYPDTNKLSPQLCEAYDDINPKTNKEAHVILRPGAYPKGIYGWLHEYHKPTLTMLCLVAAFDKMLNEGIEGLDDWKALLALGAYANLTE